MRIVVLMIVFLGALIHSEGSTEENLPTDVTFSNPSELYSTGIRALQENKPKVAFEAFNAAAHLAPNNVGILYNLGHSAFELNELGIAAGAWRRALTLSPWFKPARQALSIAEPKLDQVHSAQITLSFYEQLRMRVLRYFHLDTSLALLLLMLTIAGFIWIKNLRSQKQGLGVSFQIFLGLSVLLGLINCLKIFDHLEKRATVVEKEVQVMTAPSLEANVLFKHYQGTELILHQTQSGWAQVEQPGGLSGWVETKSLFSHSGDLLD